MFQLRTFANADLLSTIAVKETPEVFVVLLVLLLVCLLALSSRSFLLSDALAQCYQLISPTIRHTISTPLERLSSAHVLLPYTVLLDSICLLSMSTRSCSSSFCTRWMRSVAPRFSSLRFYCLLLDCRGYCLVLSSSSPPPRLSTRSGALSAFTLSCGLSSVTQRAPFTFDELRRAQP
eukprot:6187930-Pleurochrysis_carterae.AAC.1